MSLVYLVVVLKDGRRGWYVGTETRLNQLQEPTQVPLFDDEKSKQVTLEFALDTRARWRDFCRQGFGSDLHIALDKYGQFVEKDYATGLTERPVEHQARFVPLTGGGVDGLGYFVRFSPERTRWYCRAIDIPSMSAEHRDKETLWADSPEAVAQKILDVWGLKVAQPFDDPETFARVEQKRQQSEQKRFYRPGIRPGDR